MMSSLFSRTTLSCTCLAIVCCVGAINSEAQWQLTGHGILDPRGVGAFGAMTYKDGLVWAGEDSLWVSRDSGLTWQSAGFVPLPVGTRQDLIKYLAFYDRRIGFLTTMMGILYKTTDGGRTWSIPTTPTAVGQLCFDGSSNDILAAGGAGIISSRDGGMTWYSFPIDPASFVCSNSPGCGWAGGYGYSSSLRSAANEIYHTTDFGQSWSLQGSFIAARNPFPYLDNVCLDSCDDNVMYAACGESDSRVLSSRDIGKTWDTLLTKPIDVLSGSIARGVSTIYCPGADSAGGIYRTTDDGVSWLNIGGPRCPTDLQYLCLINDSLIIVGDWIGNVWRTTNSGGFPITRKPPVLAENLRQIITTDGIESDLTFKLSSVAPTIASGNSIHLSIAMNPGDFDSIVFAASPNWSCSCVLESGGIDCILTRTGSASSDTLTLGSLMLDRNSLVDTSIELSYSIVAPNSVSLSSCTFPSYNLPIHATCGSEMLQREMLGETLILGNPQPNPTTGEVSVAVDAPVDPLNLVADISDVLGTIQYSPHTLQSNGHGYTLDVDMSTLRSGIYYLSISAGWIVRRMPIVKQ